jgi:ABC-type multidrug transport system ATPase subunit
LCDRICFIFNGKVVTIGTMFELLNMSDSEYEAVIRKNQKNPVRFDNQSYIVLEDTDEYISIKFNHRHKKNVIETILSHDLELISIHPKRESLENLFEKQFYETSSDNVK